jgi:glycosyl transferase family 87
MSRRRDLRYLIIAIFVVLFGLFNSGLDDRLAGENPPPHVSAPLRPLVKAGYHFRRQTGEERFYQCFGEMALGRQYDRSFLEQHRGDLGDFETGMLGPELVTQPVLPYRDYIAEYPPANFPFIAGPSLAGKSFEYYATVFRIMLGLLNVCALMASCYLAFQYSPGTVRRFLCLSLVGAIFLGPIMITRLDPIALVFFLGALLAVAKDKPVLSGASLSLAVGAKIVPMFLIPFFFLHWWMKQETKKALRFGVSVVAGIGLIFLPALFAGPEYFQALFQFHGQRPIQVESSYAVFLRLRELLFNTPVELVHSYGSWNLEAPTSGLLASLSTPLALATVGVMLWLYRNWLKSESSADQSTREFWLLRACAATVAGLMFFSKVFSPQYLIWMWPWIFLADRGRRRIFPVVCLVAFGLTQLVAQPYATAMVLGQTWGTLLLAARNLSLFTILVLLARRPKDSEKPEGDVGDWGHKTALIPLILALISLLVSLQSRALESTWTTVRPDFKTHEFVRIEFNTSSLGSVLYRGYSGIEIEPNGRTFSWTVKPEVVHFMPATAAKSDHLLELQAINALSPDFDKGLKLLVNGRPTDIWSDNEGWPKHWTAWIPSTALKSDGLNRLTIITPTPVTPNHRDSGPNFRELGLQMDSVSYSPVEGLAHFVSPPPKKVLSTFQSSPWLVRTLSESRPDGDQWQKVEGDYWEAPSTASSKVPLESPLWFYRPGDLTTSFTQLPLGTGWYQPTADRAGRPYIYLQGSGHLSLSAPSGRTILTFSVLRTELGAPPPSLKLLVNGNETVLKSDESDWEVTYEAEFESDGGLSDFVFTDAGGWWNESPAFGRFTLKPAP